MDNQNVVIEWPDFYALLHVSPTASEEILGQCISTYDAQARVNWEHPDRQRRGEYRHMAEVTLPRCRLVLLDKRNRARYDRALLAHKSGTPQDFATFFLDLPTPKPSKKLTQSGAPLVLDTMPAGMATAIADTPVSLPSQPPRPKRVQALSQTSVHLMTAIVAFGLMSVIQNFPGTIA